MTRTLGTLAVVASLFVAGAARADDASKLQAAKGLLAQTFSQAQWKKMTDKMEAMVAAQARATGADVPFQIDSIVPYQEVSDFQLGLLMKYYSEEDMKALAAFYRTPTGKKSLEIQPELAQDLSGWLMARLAQRMPALTPKAKAKGGAHAAPRR